MPRAPPLTRAAELAALIASQQDDLSPASLRALRYGLPPNLPLPIPSSDPLITCLDPLTRAVVVLLCRARETPATVAHAFPALRAAPQTILRQAAHLIAPARFPPAYPNHLAIHRAIPNPADRLPLALRASGLFDPADSIAGLLGIHRATLYRRLDHATATLLRLR